MKTTLLASSATLTGIIKMIHDFYYAKLDPKAPIWALRDNGDKTYTVFHTTRGDKTDIRVVNKKGRFRFESIDNRIHPKN
jgi:hypothetical protein